MSYQHATLPDESIRSRHRCRHWVVAALAGAVAAGAPLPATAQYHTYPQIESTLLTAQTNYPSMCRRYDLGPTVQGRRIWALCLTDDVDLEEDEPEVKYISTMHGDEVVGVEMCLNLIDYLTANYGSDSRVTNIVDSVELWIVPCMNPDGFVAGTRGNAQGVDLNRNFPDPYTSPSNTFDGREPETANIMGWSFGQSFTLAANFHGGALVVNYPFDNNASGSSVYTPTPDDDLFIWASEEYSRYNLPMWNSSTFTHGITNGADWYAISGGMQDWSYRYMGCNEVTIEIGNIKTPPSSQIPQFWSENRDSMLAYIETSLVGVRGLVTDGATGEPLAATVRVAGRNHDVFTDPDVGDYHRMLEPGTYTLSFEANGFEAKSVPNVVVGSGSATRLEVPLWRTTVTYPDGGETLFAGVSSPVTWTGNPDAQFHVQYTANASDSSTATDGFESGVLGADYATGGHAAWAISGTNTHTGLFAVRSGSIGNSQVTWLRRTTTVSELSFWYLVSSQSGADFFTFYVDSDPKLEVSGSGAGWTQYSTTLTPGSHQLLWMYAKDGSGTGGSDAVWLDDIEVDVDNAVWSDITALTAAGATSTPWIPGLEGTDFKVRTRSYLASQYGAWDESDATFEVVALNAFGDFDGDSDVDTDDFNEFTTCFTGPDNGPVAPGCEPGDFEPDDDVDCDDWDQFVLAWTASGDPPYFAPCESGPEPIPAVSSWGTLVVALLILTAGSILAGGRRILMQAEWVMTAPRLLTLVALLGLVSPCLAAGSDGGIHAAAASGDVDRIAALIGQHPELLESRNRSGETPLLVAAGKLQVEAAASLVNAGADVRAKNRDGAMALHLCIRAGTDDAARDGRTAMVKLLLEHGADVAAVDGQGRTALHFAAIKGRFELLDLLGRSGAVLAAQDQHGRTPLHDAAMHDHVSVIEWLVARGAKIEAPDKAAETPLHVAARRFRSKAADTLLGLGASVDAVNREKATALHLTGQVRPRCT